MFLYSLNKWPGILGFLSLMEKKKKRLTRSYITADRLPWMASLLNGFSEMPKGTFKQRLDNLPTRMVWIKFCLNKKLYCWTFWLEWKFQNREFCWARKAGNKKFWLSVNKCFSSLSDAKYVFKYLLTLTLSKTCNFQEEFSLVLNLCCSWWFWGLKTKYYSLRWCLNTFRKGKQS